MGIEDPALRAAAGLDPSIVPLLAAQDAVLQAVPEFNTDFTSSPFPGLNGPVVIRYGTVADMLAVERMVGPGGGFMAEAVASLQVLTTKAPASWYRSPEKLGSPLLDLSRLPDIEGLLALYRQYSQWRSAFRSGGALPSLATSQPAPADAVGGQ